MAAAQPYADCDMNTYYSSLSLAKDRAEMHTLIKNTHRNQLPYTSSAPDVWDALIALDSDGELFCLVWFVVVGRVVGLGKCSCNIR